MDSIKLTGEDVVWIIITMMICLTLGWCATFWLLRHKDEQIKSMLLDGYVLKLLTVILVLFATSVLAVLGSLNEAVSAIFAGISGFAQD